MRKCNRRMAAKAMHRADKRWAGGQKILKLLARGAPIDAGPAGMHRLQQHYGI